MRKKHRKDKNHGRNGHVSGNPRYQRNGRLDRNEQRRNRTMGKN